MIQLVEWREEEATLVIQHKIEKRRYKGIGNMISRCLLSRASLAATLSI